MLCCNRYVRQNCEFTPVERLVEPTSDLWVATVMLIEKKWCLGSCGKRERSVCGTVFVVNAAFA